MLGAPIDPSLAQTRTWPQQNGVHPYAYPSMGQPDYTGMGALPSQHPSSSSAMYPSAYGTQAANPPYTSPYQDFPSNAYSAVAPMSTHQSSYEYSNAGHGQYQQLSRSRSDGSTSTQVSGLSSPYTQPSPMIKMEHQPDLSPYDSRYAFDNAMPQQPKFMTMGGAPLPAPQSQRPFTTSQVSYDHPPEEIKYEFNPYDFESLSLANDPRMLSPEAPSKRGYTTPEKATCACKECGMQFQRANNLKTHMQSHDTNRVHPHACEYDGCKQAFVRKTDLVRHEQSVSPSQWLVNSATIANMRLGAPERAQLSL